MISHTSSKHSWFKSLIQHKVGLTCLIILFILTILSSVAYLIIPDKTENANRQIPELALSFPGSKQNVISRPREFTNKPKNYARIVIHGRKDNIEYIPYDSLTRSESELSTYFNGKINFVELKDGLEYETIAFYLGSDRFGRDVLSRLILGLRVSLFVGFLSIIVSLFIGISLGCASGYYGGWIDRSIMLLINTAWSIPTLLMAFAIILAFGKGLMVIVLAIGLTMWVDIARIVRGQTLSIKNELFIKATRLFGFNSIKTISKHILPNIFGPILVIAAANFATAILIEAGLSFLGLGIQPPVPSLGNMLQESYAYATGGYVYLAFFPILTIMVLVLSFNLLGTSLRDVFDVKTIRS